MKKLFYFFSVLVFIFITIGCDKTTSLQTLEEKGEKSSIEYRSNTTLEDVLNNGISSTSDFELLVTNNIFPFNKLSAKSLNEFRDSLVFVNNKVRCFRSNLFYSDLTYDEALLFCKIITHSNPIFYGSNSIIFKENNSNSYNFVRDENLGTNVFFIGLINCDKTTEDCCSGKGTCINPA